MQSWHLITGGQNTVCYAALAEYVVAVDACRDDPTVMAWSLANEPRCEGDYSGSKLQACAPSLHLNLLCLVLCTVLLSYSAEHCGWYCILLRHSSCQLYIPSSFVPCIVTSCAIRRLRKCCQNLM